MAQDLEELIRNIILEETIYLRSYDGEVISNKDPLKKGRVKCIVLELAWDSLDKAPFVSPRDKHSMKPPKVGETVEISFMGGNMDRVFYRGLNSEITGNTPKAYKIPEIPILYQNPTTGDRIEYNELLKQLSIIVGSLGKIILEGKVVLNGDVNLGSSSATEPFLKSVALLVELTKASANTVALKAAFNAWTPVSGDGGLALKTALGAYLGLPSEVYTSALQSTKVFGE